MVRPEYAVTALSAVMANEMIVLQHYLTEQTMLVSQTGLSGWVNVTFSKFQVTRAGPVYGPALSIM